MHKIVARARGRGGHGDPTEPPRDHRRPLLIVAAVAVAIIIVVLHLTGLIGAGSH